MNTIVIFPIHGKAANLRHLDGKKGVAALINPGTLHKGGEVYDYNELVKTDIVLPRWIQDEMHQLQAEGYYVYFVRTPALGQGSSRLSLDDKLIPMLVSDGHALEKRVVKQ